MKKVILLLLIVLPMFAQSRDMFFNRLEKLNKKDQKKCLEVAKRYIRHFPNNSSAYYFSSIIYNKKADKSRNAIGRYRNMKRAISYALTFEEKDDGTIRAEMQWSEYTSELTERALILADELDAINEDQYSTSLLSNLDKLDKTVEIHISLISPRHTF